MFINRAVTAVTMLGGVVTTIIALVYGNAILAVISGVFFLLSFGLWKYGYIIVPVLTKATNIIEVHGGYEVPRQGIT